MLYDNDALVSTFTTQLMSQGVSIFQMWKKGLIDKEHCEWLLEMAEFPPNAHVLDIGCGIGAVAQNMMDIRPDLQVSLQNISLSQLQRCPDLPQYIGDMDVLESVPNTNFDAAMVCYALGHVKNLDEFFFNVARVLKPNGVLFVYDVLPLPGYEDWAWEVLEYRTYPTVISQYFRTLYVWSLDKTELNLVDAEQVCGTDIARDIAVRTRPVAYRWAK